MEFIFGKSKNQASAVPVSLEEQKLSAAEQLDVGIHKSVKTSYSMQEFSFAIVQKKVINCVMHAKVVSYNLCTQKVLQR